MVYTLVSAATLGFDLARLPAGHEVADVLVTGLLADPATLRRLARQHRSHCVLDDPASTPRADAGQTRRARELAAGTDGPKGLAAAAGAPAALLEQLERGTLGDVAALERLVHGDLVEAGAEVDERTLSLAREVLADAAVAGYAAPALPPELRRLLPAAYRDAVAGRRHGRVTAGDLGPQGATVLEVLDAVAARGVPRWRAAAAASRETSGAWAQAMHDACWAAHVSGRTRATAVAQLLAVQAMRDGGGTAADAAGGVWNALAGVVQGLALADLLTDEALGLLLAPWHAVLGIRLRRHLAP